MCSSTYCCPYCCTIYESSMKDLLLFLCGIFSFPLLRRKLHKWTNILSKQKCFPWSSTQVTINRWPYKMMSCTIFPVLRYWRYLIHDYTLWTLTLGAIKDIKDFRCCSPSQALIATELYKKNMNNCRVSFQECSKAFVTSTNSIFLFLFSFFTFY